jgi:hypothetical protein
VRLFLPSPFIPIAQIIERARPKRQVAGENPAGDAIVKLQDPSTKLQGIPNFKFQLMSYGASSRAPILSVGIWSFFGVWILVFGAFFVPVV